MRYVAAYLLAVLGGNDNPSAADIEKILGSVGIDVDKERLSKVISELKGKDINEVIAEGQQKLASVPSGGAVAAAGSSTGGGGDKEEAAEEKKEEKKEESEEESDDDMGFGLFD
ncbi:large ribosomal subunit protein P2-like [Dysidea avara]|uniref:large ribosomal subunit protein P2-like n=1 Tax=Dysidea avara TaxID=196820 RepID=UPI003327B6E8